ncbi:outer membrane protein assembly factor BamC [Thalassotalea maritima]|uniref:outer membrane protein assembly factor BamC n=1 Tax=Thalassotalea maritima TaxID=3242416 RepID=UPI003529ACFE
MDRRLICLPFIALSLAACSSSETRHQAKGGFDYVKINSSQQLQVPTGLEAPQNNQLYAIPQLTRTDGAVGEKIDVRAPSQVLPLAAGSRVDEFDNSAAIWFDKVDDSRDLRQYVVRAITGYLEEKNVGLKRGDEENNVWESDWFQRNEESGALFWQTIESSESWRFRYSLVTKPHGRSVGLNVELIDYMLTDQNSTTKQISPLEKERVEIAMVNEISAQMDYLYRVNNRDDRLGRANMQLVKKTLTESGEPALLIEYPADDVWSYLPGFFEDNNFTIVDLNEDNRVYEVEYTYVEPSIWSKMWADEISVLSLANGVYRFKVESQGDKSVLRIMDAKNQPIEQAKFDENLPLLESALSFRN